MFVTVDLALLKRPAMPERVFSSARAERSRGIVANKNAVVDVEQQFQMAYVDGRIAGI